MKMHFGHFQPFHFYRFPSWHFGHCGFFAFGGHLLGGFGLLAFIMLVVAAFIISACWLADRKTPKQ